MLRSHSGGFTGAGCLGLAVANIQQKIKIQNQNLKIKFYQKLNNEKKCICNWFSVICYYNVCILYHKYFFRNVDYFKNSIFLNAFLLPLFFAIAAFYSVTTYSKFKKVLSFKEAYGRAFIPMFVGGFLSVLSIFLYINIIDKPTKDLLNHQYIESYKNSLEEEYQESKKVLKPDSAEMPELEKKYQEGKLRIAHKIAQKEDMFSIKYFGYIFAGFCAYFLILSLFFGSFFRTKYSEIHQ